jgi:3-oxoadipate enol-lactonase
MSRRTVLVHSGIASPAMWEGFDIPGLRHHLEDDLAETVGDEPVALVGASYGGLVCLDFAARNPELVSALVVMGAPLPDHDWSDPDLLAYGEEEERLLEAGELDAAAELNIRFWNVPEALHGQVRGSLEYDVPEIESVDLAAAAMPVLVVVGEHDKPDFRAIAERLAREIANAEFAVIADAGHLPAVERPEATAEVVSRFLSGIDSL